MQTGRHDDEYDRLCDTQLLSVILQYACGANQRFCVTVSFRWKVLGRLLLWLVTSRTTGHGVTGK